MDNWLEQVTAFLPDGNGYFWVIFLIAFSESLPLIGLLVPGSTLIVLAGFLVVHGKASLLPLISVSATGALLGDMLSFWLGLRYGSIFLRLQVFQKHHRLVSLSESFFVDHGGKSIFFARFLGPIRGITPFIAGLSGMTRRPFLIYAVISAILWGICYPGLGFFGGSSWQNAQSLSGRFGLLILLLLGLTVFHYWVKKRIK
ncbi:DedA family protein [Pelobacter seleniigenes]|uniref:DedA family protein n=1 Tax=Pelobacter seleniigenes TaxID=407188 RepID=UPI00068D8B2F|nr:DedA family protein [Pelobacter seleniigenes]